MCSLRRIPEDGRVRAPHVVAKDCFDAGADRAGDPFHSAWRRPYIHA